MMQRPTSGCTPSMGKTTLVRSMPLALVDKLQERDFRSSSQYILDIHEGNNET
jgi:hypothetical protein